jgi:hypothetical protein
MRDLGQEVGEAALVDDAEFLKQSLGFRRRQGVSIALPDGAPLPARWRWRQFFEEINREHRASGA